MQSKAEETTQPLDDEGAIERRHKQLIEAIDNVANAINGFNFTFQDFMQYSNQVYITGIDKQVAAAFNRGKKQ